MFSINWLLGHRQERLNDLSKAFLIAFAFHMSFIFFFKIVATETKEHPPLLPFTSVEVDLGDKQQSILLNGHDVHLMLPNEHPLLPFLSSNFNIADEESLKKKYSKLMQPDFSPLEQIPYTSLREDYD